MLVQTEGEVDVQVLQGVAGYKNVAHDNVNEYWLAVVNNIDRYLLVFEYTKPLLSGLYFVCSCSAYLHVQQ